MRACPAPLRSARSTAAPLRGRSEPAVAAFVPAGKQDEILILLRLDRALLELFAGPRPEHHGVSHCQGQVRLVMTPAIGDFAAIKARLDELRREKVQQQPLPDTDTGGPAVPNSEPVYDCA